MRQGQHGRARSVLRYSYMMSFARPSTAGTILQPEEDGVGMLLGCLCGAIVVRVNVAAYVPVE